MKDNGDTVHRIMSLNYLIPFGYISPAPASIKGHAAGIVAPMAGTSATGGD